MDIGKVREEFEQYVKDKNPYGDISRLGDGYANYYTNELWHIYQHTLSSFNKIFNDQQGA